MRRRPRAMSSGQMRDGSTVRFLTCAETAVEVRHALREQFPGVKFSVRTSVYSGGAAIRVRWTGGPSVREVEAAADQFQRSDFDGMTDSTTMRPAAILRGERVKFGADFIFGFRDEPNDDGERWCPRCADSYNVASGTHECLP
jgi:Large polyvalent protein associated domain 29